MNLKIHEKATGHVAEVESGNVFVTVDDFLDIIGNANYQGVEKLIIHKHNIHPNFFDLKTKLAGDVLQKFSNYRQKLAIVGDFSSYTSKSLHDFIRESNRGTQILFVGTVNDAIEKL